MPLSDSQRKSIALLILRAGLGLTMAIAHGWSKLTGGTAKWEKLGAAGVDWVGIEFGHVFFGGFASVAESICALMVALGVFTRSAATCVAVTMFMAMMSHYMDGQAFRGGSHALELWIAFSAIAMLGPGRFSIDSLLAARKDQAR